MSQQIIVIETPGTYLRLDQTRLAIDSPIGARVTRPIDEIAMLMINTQQATITAGLIAALAEVNTTLLVCNDKREPVAQILPLSGHSLSPDLLKKQISLKIPFKKKMWSTLVQGKILNQSENFITDIDVKKSLFNLSKQIKSGDRTNRESVAAKLYWSKIFRSYDGHFKRIGDHPYNSLLNYGYAVVRSAIARSLVVSGLNPSLGIFHSSRSNTFALADDVIEPFRPLVDRWVIEKIIKKEPSIRSITPIHKNLIIKILTSRMKNNLLKEEMGFLSLIEKSVISIKNSIQTNQVKIFLPIQCEFLDTE